MTNISSNVNSHTSGSRMLASTRLPDLDSTKVLYYPDRIRDYLAGKRISPITVDMALTRGCNYACEYCYGKLQDNSSSLGRGLPILSWATLQRFLIDCLLLGVRGVSLVSDGESTCHPAYAKFIWYGDLLGLAMALGSHGYNFTSKSLSEIIPGLTYLRFNISSAEPSTYGKIHGVDAEYLSRVESNIRFAVEYRDSIKSGCSIGMQMVLLPEYESEILPLANLAVSLGVDYLVIKHCSDDELGSLGVDYSAYEALTPTLQRAEAMSTSKTHVIVKWNKIREGNIRSYSRCYGPPFIIQVSGTGLVAPCGMLFADKYKEYHIGNIRDNSFRSLVQGERYWEVMSKIASPEFDARTMCGCLCLQHATNRCLSTIVDTGEIPAPPSAKTEHIQFI